MIMECLAIIPARGGSKGIPRKNLKTVDGVPLVVRSVRSALSASHITRTVVSTDDEEIASVVREAGAEVIIRSEALADDAASSESALLHVLETLAADEGYQSDLTCFIQCTSPLTTSDDLDKSIEMLQAQKADCLVAVVPTYDFLWRRMADGSTQAINHNPSVIRKGRQELEPQYRETGAFYMLRTEGFLAAGNRFFGRVALFEMPPERSVDIDGSLDLELAEFLIARNARHSE
jgi:N-acylneuraminate cytidylyltransferase